MPEMEPLPLKETYLLIRLAREWDLRFENLFRTGSLKKWYSSVGNEALTVPAAAALEPGDAICTLHRDVGAILRHSLDVSRLFPDLAGVGKPPRPDRRGDPRAYLHALACQMLGKREGFTAGYDRSYHYSVIDEPRDVIHVGMISHLGAMVPVAAGLALALKRRGRGRVALNFIGEGGTSTGDFHEGLNMAAVLRLPLILVIENNHYAFSTPGREQYAAGALVDRAPGYGVRGESVDGGDPLAVHRAVLRAAEAAREEAGPTLIEADLVRLRGHSEGDDSLNAVPPDDLARYRRDDPILRFEKTLLQKGVLAPGEPEAIGEQIRELLIEVTDRARATAEPEPGPRPIFMAAAGAGSGPAAAEVSPPVRPSAGSKGREAGATYLEAISRALLEEMRRDPQVLLLGQDIAEYGGAFKATRGFLEEFGRDRVINTPIAESGTIGIACGAALLGLRPVVEMQFADFISCGFNQAVNVVAKMYYRSGLPVPMVIRCPVGGGAAAGPFHSQCPEAWFLHVAGLKVVAPAFPGDALGLLKAAIRDPDPILYLEHKHLYRSVRAPLPEGEHLTPLGKARVAREGSDVTVITWGWMVHRALAAAESLSAEGTSVEVLDLRTLCPLDEAAVLASVGKTARALVLHEAPLTGGFGGEIAARILEQAFDRLDAPVRRLAHPDTPVPYHPDLEAASIPDEAKIASAIRELARY